MHAPQNSCLLGAHARMWPSCLDESCGDLEGQNAFRDLCFQWKLNSVPSEETVGHCFQLSRTLTLSKDSREGGGTSCFLRLIFIMCMHVYVTEATKARDGIQIPLELRLQVVVSCSTWVLRTQLLPGSGGARL